MKKDQVTNYQAERVKIGKAEIAYLKLKDDFGALTTARKQIEQFNLKEPTTISKCYKRNDDNVLPKKGRIGQTVPLSINRSMTMVNQRHWACKRWKIVS